MKYRAMLVTLSGALAIGACASAPVTSSAPAAMAAPVGPDRPIAYLADAELPEGLTLVPAAPAAGSAEQVRDLDGARRAIAQRGSPRWALATTDAELFTGNATSSMACAAGRQIDATTTPLTFKLLSRAGVDFSSSTHSAKVRYNRPRPFMENGQPSCTPDAESYLRKNGSYPSGHSAIGYGWGLVLAQLIPDRTTALVSRGRSFGDSRRVCNVHWLSDIEEGRVTATATFARLQSSPGFLADVAAARRELAELPAMAPKADCAAEAAALAGT